MAAEDLLGEASIEVAATGEPIGAPARVLTGATVGLEGALVEVEVDLAQGLPNFTVVGLPDAAVQEARPDGCPSSEPTPPFIGLPRSGARAPAGD